MGLSEAKRQTQGSNCQEVSRQGIVGKGEAQEGMEGKRANS